LSGGRLRRQWRRDGDEPAAAPTKLTMWSAR